MLAVLVQPAEQLQDRGEPLLVAAPARRGWPSAPLGEQALGRVTERGRYLGLDVGFLVEGVGAPLVVHVPELYGFATDPHSGVKGRCGAPLRSASSLGLRPSLDPARVGARGASMDRMPTSGPDGARHPILGEGR